jgi:hypothetical protein
MYVVRHVFFYSATAGTFMIGFTTLSVSRTLLLVINLYVFTDTGWTVRGSNPDGDEIFRTHPDGPWGPPSLLYNGYRVFPGGKAAGAWC